MELVLASASPRRRDLLAQIGVTPDAILSPNIEEVPFSGELPRAFARRLSLEKAQSCAQIAPTGSIILSADTVVSVGRRILDKPDDEHGARTHLKLLSGRRHRVTTAVTLVASDRDASHTKVAETLVRFKRLSARDIDDYLQSGEWRGKAGGYAIQGRAAAFIPWIEGSYSNVVGLPLVETANLLTVAGYRR